MVDVNLYVLPPARLVVGLLHGWVVGHSYIIYVRFFLGATSIHV